MCLAVRVSEAVALLNSEQMESENASERIKYSGRELTQAILLHRMGKKCKQRFLQAHRRDSYISKSRRGYGGNAASLTCMAIAQERIPSDVIQLFRDGGSLHPSCKIAVVQYVFLVMPWLWSYKLHSYSPSR